MVTTSDLVEVVARAPHNVGPHHRRAWLRDELEKLGGSEAEVVSAAVAGMESDDRNVRVKMLRVLALFEDPRATAAVLKALHDSARRVCDVAIKSTPPHHMTPEVVARLRAIVDDESTISGLRREAFFALSSSVASETVPEVTREALIGLMDSPRFRLDILVRLCESLVQPAGARSILQEFVSTGSTEEAVMATRALCGHMLMPVSGWMPNEVRQRVRATYDPAPKIYGVPRVWIPRDDAVAIVTEVYPPPS